MVSETNSQIKVIGEELKNQLEELFNMVFAAKANFEIWWIYSNADDRKIYGDALNECWESIRTTKQAHFAALILALHKLYENKPNTINIKSVKEYMVIKNLFGKEIKTEIETILTSLDEKKKKIEILRHNVFAHQSKKLDYNEAFKRAEITPDQIRELIHTTLGVINLLSYASIKTTRDFSALDGYIREDTYKILDCLQRGFEEGFFQAEGSD